MLVASLEAAVMATPFAGLVAQPVSGRPLGGDDAAPAGRHLKLSRPTPTGVETGRHGRVDLSALAVHEYPSLTWSGQRICLFGAYASTLE